jgi:cold shock CspA family protein
MSDRITGTCKVWRGEYGFVIADDGSDVFLHCRECARCGIQPPAEADRLEFEIDRGPKGFRAVRVSYVIAA